MAGPRGSLRRWSRGVAVVLAGLLLPLGAPAADAQQPQDGLGDVTGFAADGAVYTIRAGEAVAQVSFLSDDTFRIHASPDGVLTDPANTPPSDPEAPSAVLVVGDRTPDADTTWADLGDRYRIATAEVALHVHKSPLRFTLTDADDERVIFSEVAPLTFSPEGAVQRLARGADEQFFGGGMQNGRFSHRGSTIQIARDFNWNDGGNPNAAPFYMSTAGYGVFRNTFAPGTYAFGDPVTTRHAEQRFDAYYFVGDLPTILDRYTALTGRPLMPPIYGLELGDADCYNSGGRRTYPDAVRVAQAYVDHDMPRGWMLVNDGYGCGYVELERVGQELAARNITLGLWTDQALTNQEYEVGVAGVRVRKLDVAWVGQGYRFALSACEDAYDGIERYSDARGYVWMVEGWAGAQRCAVLWTGDQSGSWENIRFHIPTIHGSGLSGQAWVAGDVDGIFGGSDKTYVRDLQWKVFTPALMTMSGWAPLDKQPWVRGEPYTSINRRYLRLRERLLPYFYTYAAEAHRSGMPVARSLVLEHPDDPNTWDDTAAYEFLAGEAFLVAPVYTDSEVRDGIYLPEGTWIDYWTGRLHQGPMTLNGYRAPLDTLPLFVKAGAVVPMWPEGINSFREVSPGDPITFDVYPQGRSSFTLYEDDLVTREHAEGEHAEQTVTVDAPERGRGTVTVTIGPSVGHYDGKPAQRPYEVTAHTGSEPAVVTLDRRPLPQHATRAAYDAADSGWYYDPADRGGVVYVKTPPRPLSATTQIDLRGASAVGGPHPEDRTAEVTLDTPDLALPGQPAEVTATFVNDTGRRVAEPTFDLRVPEGWTVEQTSPPAPRWVDPGEAVTTTFAVTPGASTAPQRYVLAVDVAYRARGTTLSVGDRASVQVPYPSLAAAFNNVAITSVDDTAPGDFDGGGNSYSAEELARVGATPGATVVHDGIAFTWPDVPPGTPDNVVARGQTIALSGRGTTLAFLGAEAGQVEGTVTVHYADGTTQTASLGFPNWCCLDPTAFGAEIALETTYRHTQQGPANFGIAYRVFFNQVRIDPDREVVAVTLPDASAIHVFAMAIADVPLPDPPRGTVHLSDLEWLSARNGWGPVERDRSNGETAAGDGGPLTIDGVVYDKGLGTHAPARVSYHLGGACTRLTAVLGVDDSRGNGGSVTYEVHLDGERVYDSGVLTGASPARILDVDVSGARYLDLVVTDAGDGNTADHANWADARLECAD